MTKADLENLLVSLNVPFAIVADVSTGSIERVGDPSSIQPSGLIKVLFGDEEAVGALQDSLTGQTLPRSFRQGDVGAVLCKPKPDLIVGLFAKVSLDPVAYHQWTKRLCEAVNTVWK
jgi:hypothetical protein